MKNQAIFPFCRVCHMRGLTYFSPLQLSSQIYCCLSLSHSLLSFSLFPLFSHALSFSLYVYLYAYLYICLSICLSTRLFLCCHSIYLTSHLILCCHSIYLSSHIILCLFPPFPAAIFSSLCAYIIILIIRLSTYMLVFISVCLSMYPLHIS